MNECRGKVRKSLSLGPDVTFFSDSEKRLFAIVLLWLGVFLLTSNTLSGRVIVVPQILVITIKDDLRIEPFEVLEPIKPKTHRITAPETLLPNRKPTVHALATAGTGNGEIASRGISHAGGDVHQYRPVRQIDFSWFFPRADVIDATVAVRHERPRPGLCAMSRRHHCGAAYPMLSRTVRGSGVVMCAPPHVGGGCHAA